MLKIVLAVVAYGLVTPPIADGPLDWDALALPGDDRVPADESAFPASIRQRVGRTISLRGYMHPNVPFTTNIERFILCAETNGKENAGNRLHHFVFVEMQGDARAEFNAARPIVVTGKLSIDVVRDADGKVLCLYRLKATSAAKTAPRPGYRGPWKEGC